MQWKKRFDRAMLGTIFTLAWPTMLEQLTQTAVQYIDTAMVGSLGTRATAAVGATSTVSWMIGSVVSAIGIGFLAEESEEVFRRENEDFPVTKQKIMMNAWNGLGVDEWLKPFDDSKLPLRAEYKSIKYIPFVD